jgi:hypothetical protein
MNLIIDLSKYISIPIFCVWLHLNDLIKTDSALCNNKYRVLFLNLLQNEPFKYTEVLSVTLFSSTKWLLKPNYEIFQLNLFDKSWAAIKQKTLSFSFLNKLKCLNLEEGSISRRNKCLDLISTTRSLTCINFGACRFVNDTVILAIAKHCGQLTTFLCLNHNYVNYHIHDESIIQLTLQCTFLEVLHLGNCSELTNKTGIAISLNCGELLNLAMCNIPNFTDKTMDALSHCNDSKCLELTDLYIGNCDCLTNVGISFFYIS